MIRFLFRFTGLWMLAGAFVALVIDGTRSVSASRLVFYSVRDASAVFDAARPAALEQAFAGSALEEVFAQFLALPLFVLLAVLGILLVLIGRKRHSRSIGYSSRD